MRFQAEVCRKPNSGREDEKPVQVGASLTIVADTEGQARDAGQKLLSSDYTLGDVTEHRQG